MGEENKAYMKEIGEACIIESKCKNISTEQNDCVVVLNCEK